MTHLLKSFWGEESGAVTVDWVVLTAGIVLLAVGVVVPIGMTVTDSSDDVGEYVGSMTIATY